MAKLKFKNATNGVFILTYNHPASGKHVHQPIDALSTAIVFDGDLDKCSAIRLQYPDIPDNQDVALSDAPLQFVWDNALPDLDDYLASSAIGDDKASTDAKKALKETVAAAIAPLTEESEIVVQVGGKKDQIKATGTEVQ